ncbi:MAG: roadblock/LC7 domain-containing protein [Holophagaceae bacterium]|nr:roadblock/LC7 domain-containing protein [Holophagaceae bacterium]
MRLNADKLAQLKSIPGLAGHVLVGPSGELLSHDAPNAESLAALVAICRQSSPAAERELMSSPVHSLAFHRGHNERFFIMPLGKDSIGFFQKKEAVGVELLAQVTEWMDSLGE